ncbi:MAG: DUF4388 domain-containing protein [Cyanobacteria bacterium J06642_9]
MSIHGHLSEFSLPEILNFLQQHQKTGRLFVQATDNVSDHPLFFVWLQGGRIVAVANRLDGLGLTSFLQDYGQLKSNIIPQLLRQRPHDISLGAYVQQAQVLPPKQIKTLFKLQVTRQMKRLFRISQARFRFTDNAPMPLLEMTGLSIPAKAMTLPAMRALQNWESLQAKLPDKQSGLKRLVETPKLRLTQSESALWQAIEPQQTIAQLSKKLSTPLDTLQKVAFRLIFVGLAAEVAPMKFATSSRPMTHHILVPLGNSPQFSPARAGFGC